MSALFFIIWILVFVAAYWLIHAKVANPRIKLLLNVVVSIVVVVWLLEVTNFLDYLSGVRIGDG